MAISKAKINEIVMKAFPDADIAITDLVGDSDHYKLVIYSDEFDGLSMMEQHRKVYRCLQEFIGKELHAITLETAIKG